MKLMKRTAFEPGPGVVIDAGPCSVARKLGSHAHEYRLGDGIENLGFGRQGELPG
jgi:hypothetical protein